MANDVERGQLVRAPITRDQKMVNLMGRLFSWCALVLGVILVAACQSNRYVAGSERLGGDSTVFDTSFNAFEYPMAGLPREQELLFHVGNSFFEQNWVTAPASTTARDGVGPLHNSRSCAGCHLKDGRGRPPLAGETGTGLLLRLSVPGETETGSPLPEPTYGGQLQDGAIEGVEVEGQIVIDYTERAGTFADGTPYTLREPTYRIGELAYGDLHPDVLISPRIANQVIGLGLLAAVPEATLLDLADEQDADGDGISGRPNVVFNRVTGEREIGRFGWKANQPTLLQQSAAAFLGDMGITNDLMRAQDCTPIQANCAAAPTGGDPEIEFADLEKVAHYVATLAVPAQRTPQDKMVLRGEREFLAAGCGSCHTPELTTGNHTLPPLANQTIRPFTDLLLHDMGAGLADGRPDFLATGSEWRTPPLWGIGLFETVNGHTFYLHDGRARNLTEAILWHGGEATAARDLFLNMSKTARDALIAFLESL
jgi:CxxC motif-containing protein (DUF1111 family)